jgi:HTH-type transcriptional regulator, glycine betaine synthesis regulator
MNNKNDKYDDILKEAEDLVIDAIGVTMDLYGVTQSIGRLYGILYFKNDPLTLDNMSEELGMSKPSMSTGIRTLQQIDMVYKVWQKGVRKDLYQAEKDFFKSFISFFCKKWKREIEVNSEAIARAEELLVPLVDDPNVPVWIYDKAKIDLEQLNQSKQYYDWLKKLVNVFESKEIFKILEEHVPDNMQN